jgi:hypothetical protein
MWQLVVGPVILGVIGVVAAFVLAGPTIARRAKQARDAISDTISEITETWRSRE